MRPYFIEQRLKLRNQSIVKLPLTLWDVRLKPLQNIFAPGGHQKTIKLNYLLGKLDFVDQVKAAFGL
jgi:hypothetical protein